MEYEGLWVMFQIVFMAVWALIYAALIAFNLLRRKPVYPIVWAGFGLTLLLAYSYFPVLEHMVTACGGVLRYVAQKTGAHIEVPCRREVAGWLAEIRRLGGFSLSTPGYIKTLRRLCERAGIDSEVKVRKAGRDFTARKWECVSGHTARISFCTNLAVAGVPLCDIKTLAGHTSEAMTERYIAAHTPKLGSRALELLTGTDG